MSMHPQPIPAIPEETIRVARAVLPKGNVFLRMRDELGTLYTDEDFRDLFPIRGQPAETPWHLALVTLMHYAEGLTDRQAADAVHTRIDWKYVLSLELTDTGFDFSVLSEFRSHLLEQGAERRSTAFTLARSRQETPEFRNLYAKRAGVEGTVAQAVRTCEMRQARYIGSKKLRLQAFFTAAAMNVLRAVQWLTGERPPSTPVSRFAKLVASAKLLAAA